MANEKGFTLFEILVAVSIFAVIAAMTMTSLIQVGKTGEQVSDSQQQLAEIQFALGYFGKDIAQISNRKVRDQYGDEQPQFVISSEKMTFTRSGWSNLLQQPRSNLQRVEYRLEDNILQRSYWPQLDQGFTEVRVDQPLLRRVEDFSVKLLADSKDKIENWPLDTEVSSITPVAIELTIDLNGFGRIQRIYEISNALL